MMASTRSLYIFVSAILLVLLSGVGQTQEEISEEQGLFHEGLHLSEEQAVISACPESCSKGRPPEMPSSIPLGEIPPPQSSPQPTQVSPVAPPAYAEIPPPAEPHLYQPARTPIDDSPPLPAYPKPSCGPSEEGYTVNFEDISIIQLIQFISKISGANFIFNSAELQGPDGKPLSVTIVSEDPASVNDLSAALLQILKMNNLSVVEQGKNVLIYRNQNMSKVSTIITDDNIDAACGSAIITRVFQLYNLDAHKIAAIVRTLVSPEANVEPSPETRHLIVTDITANVNKIADLLQTLDTPNLAVDIEEYHVQNADPNSLADYARQILAPLAAGTVFSITAEGTSQTIFVVSTPFIIAKARRILTSLDVAEISSLSPPPSPITSLANNAFRMYKLKYTNGQEIADALHEIGTNLQSTGISNVDFVNTIYSVQWVEVNNSLVMAGTEESIDKVVTLIDELDISPKQVYIEVLILDTTLANSLDFGVQWIALGDEQNRLAYASGLLSQAPPNPILQGTNTTNPGARFVAANNTPLNSTGSPPAVPNPGRDVALPDPSQLTGISGIAAETAAFGLGIIGNIIRHNGQSFLTLGALLSALDEEYDTTVVLNPKIMVEDTQSADFFVGQNIPYQTTSTVIQQTGSVTQNIQYEDVGIELQITPTISPDNIVTLQINQTVADIVGSAGSSNLTPVTNKILATTRVHVPDGTFLVMSGHVRDETDYIRSGIPCLGTLPLIGPAFSRTIEVRQKRNLIFFVRPKVITNPQGGVDLTDEEGYEYNWQTNPCSILECGPVEAPECQVYPLPPELQH
jgi:type III secretion protein C